MDEIDDTDLFEEDDIEHMIEENEDESVEKQDGNDDERGENKDNEIEDTQNIKKDIKKRVVRNPRVKLDASRLCGERGIAILPKIFEDVRFKGKGYEKEDLNKLMSTLEHWAYRMYPCVSFDECLQTIEKLGNKAPVKVYLKKLRLDMPLLTNDFIRDDNEDKDENSSENIPMMTDEDRFDSLIKEYENQNQANSSFLSGIDPINYSLPDESCTSKSPLKFPKEFTDEQKERMEKNKRIAMQRRLLSENIGNEGSSQTNMESVTNEIEKNNYSLTNNDDDLSEKSIMTHLNDSNLDTLISNNKTVEKEHPEENPQCFIGKNSNNKLNMNSLNSDKVLSIEEPKYIDDLENNDYSKKELDCYAIQNDDKLNTSSKKKLNSAVIDEEPIDIDSDDSDCLRIACDEDSYN
ncbi:TIMELESS-interacting protein-like [Centruroides sculpturatus]|uniref:TIMELESS-interacting protein-like n=1 Tax=Centruroides sculpturatus TaxID=218467 RepID=UPI000C6D491F|nr:TIMELESS-interacting protein-like [Centruroides sculpturatus]XP_023236498.1 TIMELESS-interacting protein-like [Centruroides sculpturatus]